jgi:Fe-S cluster assembly protein SufD
MQESSVFDSYVASWGGNITRNNLTAYMNGVHSECILRGLYYISGKSLIDNHTTVEHRVPECHSNELYKGIINDSGWGVFNGKIIVDKDAQKTNAYQSNKNILLSDDAVINAKPQLEINADDVKCSHGATTGQIDPEELFYLRSRGISLDEAKRLLLFAFLDGIITEYKNETVREYLEKKLHKKLDNGNNL